MNPRNIKHHTMLIGIVLLFFLSACTKQIKPTTDAIKQDASLEELLALYQNRLGMNTDLKALIKVDADLGERGHHTLQSAWRSSKKEIQLRGFNSFGGTLFELNVDSNSFSLKIPSEPHVFEADLDFYESVAGKQIPFGSLDLLRWVQRGGVPDTAFPNIPMLEKGERFYTLYLFVMIQGRAVLSEKVFIDRTAFRVKRIEGFDPTGIRRGIIVLDDYKMIDGRQFPLSMKGIGGGEVIDLRFHEVSFPEPKSAETP